MKSKIEKLIELENELRSLKKHLYYESTDGLRAEINEVGLTCKGNLRVDSFNRFISFLDGAIRPEQRAIKKSDLNEIWRHEEYIKSCCNVVTSVYGCSIYFCNERDTSWFYGWSEHSDVTIVLNHINALCGTNFIFEEEEV